MVEAVVKRRWMPLVLGVSLALNFAVIAALGGAAWRHQGEERGGPRGGAKGGALYMKALPREARQAIRAQTREAPRMRMDATAMIATLRSEPFDAAAAVRMLEAQRSAGLERQKAASTAWLAQINAMTSQERTAYADRIEEMAAGGKSRWKERKNKGD